MSDFNYGDLGDSEYSSPERPTRTDFLVWHRPRKQLIRFKQWVHEASELIRRNDRPNLRYFGLPGIDMLDLRALYQGLCEHSKTNLTFLGLASEVANDEKARHAKEITLQQLKQLEFTTDNSDVIGEAFESLSSTASPLFATASAMGPFDIINLDLCDGLLDKSPHAGSKNCYSALQQLMSIQSRAVLPWLLFVTTRISREAVHADTLVLLKTALEESECKDLLETFAAMVDVDLPGFDPDGCSDEHFATFVALALTAWLTNLAQTGTPQRIAVRPYYAYRVQSTAPAHDMLSLAIRFSPKLGATTPDSFGMAKAAADPGIGYCDSLKSALAQIQKRSDADDLLILDPQLRSQMVTETGSLLQWARYDLDAYYKWVENFAS